jgi:hypothetical protein
MDTKRISKLLTPDAAWRKARQARPESRADLVGLIRTGTFRRRDLRPDRIRLERLARPSGLAGKAYHRPD